PGPGLLGPPGDRFHHPAVAAAAHRKTRRAKRPPERAGFRVVRVRFRGTRAAEDGDDPLGRHSGFRQQEPPAASNSSIMAIEMASRASVASCPFDPMLLLMNENTRRRPLGSSA